MQGFEVSMILPDALGPVGLPACEGAEMAFGRSGFLVARFDRNHDRSLASDVARAIERLAAAVPHADLLKIEFHRSVTEA